MHMTPIVAGRYSTSGCLLWHEKGENMEITAIAIEAKKYTLPVILIGQLGKNYADGNNQFIRKETL